LHEIYFLLELKNIQQRELLICKERIQALEFEYAQLEAETNKNTHSLITKHERGSSSYRKVPIYIFLYSVYVSAEMASLLTEWETRENVISGLITGK
jgi:hypothetical protein